MMTILLQVFLREFLVGIWFMFSWYVLNLSTSFLSIFDVKSENILGFQSHSVSPRGSLTLVWCKQLLLREFDCLQCSISLGVW